MNIVLTALPQDYFELPYRMLSILKSTPQQISFYILIRDPLELPNHNRILPTLIHLCRMHNDSKVFVRKLDLDPAVHAEGFLTVPNGRDELKLKKQIRYVLPDSVDRAIYLSHNALVIGDLSSLWNFEVPAGGCIGIPADIDGKICNPEVMLLDMVNLRKTDYGLVPPVPGVFSLPKEFGFSQKSLAMDESGNYRLTELTFEEHLDLFLSQAAIRRIPIFVYGEEESGIRFYDRPAFQLRRKSLEGEMPYDSDILIAWDEDRFNKNFEMMKSLSTFQLQRYAQPPNPIPEYITKVVAEQISFQPEFFTLPKETFVVWGMCANDVGLDVFLDYYGRICPPGTHAVFLMDRWIKNIAEIKAKISATWPTLFFDIPGDSPILWDNFRIGVYNTLYPKTIGQGCWNLFIDMDEFLPLPKEYPALAQFLTFLEQKDIHQLVTAMLDVYEFMQKGVEDRYVGMLHSDTYNDWTSFNFMDTPFITDEGLPSWYHTYFRDRVILNNFGPEVVNKTALVWGEEGNLYPPANHSPHRHFQTRNEAITRWPLIHYKFLKDTFLRVTESYLHRFELIEKTGRYKDNLGVSVYEDKLATQVKKIEQEKENGFGPYKIFGPKDNDLLFEEFGKVILPLKDLVDENHQFSLTGETRLLKGNTPSFFPMIHIEPLR